MRKHYTTAQRAELTSLVASGQATPRIAAARLGVPVTTAYNWLRGSNRRAAAVALAARQTPPRTVAPRTAASAQTPAFARLVRAGDGTSLLLLRVGEVTLEVRPGFDPVLLRATIAALTEQAS